MNKKFINLKQACELLNLSESTLYKRTSAKTIPFYKPAGKLLFCPDELEDFVKKSKKSIKPINNEVDDSFLITSLAA
jgi:excisionase family DNA binding protein